MYAECTIYVTSMSHSTVDVYIGPELLQLRASRSRMCQANQVPETSCPLPNLRKPAFRTDVWAKKVCVRTPNIPKPIQKLSRAVQLLRSACTTSSSWPREQYWDMTAKMSWRIPHRNLRENEIRVSWYVVAGRMLRAVSKGVMCGFGEISSHKCWHLTLQIYNAATAPA